MATAHNGQKQKKVPCAAAHSAPSANATNVFVALS